MGLRKRPDSGFRRTVRDERGIALISAIGVLATLSMLGVSAIAYSSSNYRAAELSSSGDVARHAADGGLNQAISVLANSPSPLSPDALPAGQATLEGETVTWSGVLDGDVWDITAVSSVRNPTGAAALQRTVKAKVRVSLAAPGGAWNYVYTDGAGCTSLDNNVVIEPPLFVRGDLCLSNSAKATGPSVTVGGTLFVKNPQASVGKASARVAEAHIGTGCRYVNRALASPCGDKENVFVAAPGADANVATLAKPPLELAKWYTEAKPGPRANCTSGGFPGGFDTNDGVMNRSLLLPVNLMPATPYDCVVKSGKHTLGRIAWTGGASGTLTIRGTIFFDGDIVLTNNADALYKGRGVIYASGRIEIDNWTTVCGAAGCNAAVWDPNENLIVFVAGSATDANGFYIGNNAKLQAAVYAATDARAENGSTLQGPVIARQLYSTQFASLLGWRPIKRLLVGSPSESSATTVTFESGSWGG